MAKAPPTVEPHVERPGPAEFRDPFVRRELAKAAVWFGTALAIAGVSVLGQPLRAMIVIGSFLASEPRVYDRGSAWMLPLGARGGFYRMAERVGFTLRRLLFGRLLAMVFEGVCTWFMLTLGGIPMAGLLGLITGVLAFIPNIGAITSGLVMIAVGFSASYGHGIWCIIVYFLVHNIDAYVVVPYVARRTVDIAPAVLLAMQLLMAALFGILGVLFADPILATLKVVLIDVSKQRAS